MMLLTANLSLPRLCLLLVRGCPKLLTMWKRSFIWNDCRKNFFFSRKAFHVKCTLCSCCKLVFTEHLLCASLAKELPCSQRAQNSEFVFWMLLWLKYRYSGRQKQRCLTQEKLPQRSKSKLRSVRWMGLANKDWTLRAGACLSVHYSVNTEWRNEWLNHWSS